MLFSSQALIADQGYRDVLQNVALHSLSVVQYEEKLVAFYLDEPVISVGELRFEPPDKLTKIMLAPERVTQEITGSEIVVSRESGEKEQFSLSRHPALEIVANTLRSLLAGNVSYFEQNYVIEFHIEKGDWRMLLTPSDKKISEWIQKVEVLGVEKRITQFTVTEANGDYTTTTLNEK